MKEEYKIGVEVVDQQHAKLFEIAEKAYQVMKDNYIVDKYDEIVSIIVELKDYTIFHFETEEGYMKGIGYRRYFSHKVEHMDFIASLKEVDFSEIETNQEEFLMNLFEFLNNWLINHIMEKDKLIMTGA